MADKDKIQWVVCGDPGIIPSGDFAGCEYVTVVCKGLKKRPDGTFEDCPADEKPDAVQILNQKKFT